MTSDKKYEFIKNNIIPSMIKNNDCFNNQTLTDCILDDSVQSIDGFMSKIYKINLVTQDTGENGIKYNYPIIVKIMKGDQAFRTKTKSNQQFTNEIYIYSDVIPAFHQLVQSSKSQINVDNWSPKVYYSNKGKFDGFSDEYETILVLENLAPQGFKGGPRLDLDEDHLYLMTKLIAEYHSCNYAMKILKDLKYEKLSSGLVPLRFNDERNFWHILYEHGMERTYKYLDAKPAHFKDDKFKQDMINLKNKYYDKPVDILEMMLRNDEHYSIILHGDYNRNNILFKYDENGKPIDIRMIDYQEVRYATPLLDLSFYFFMNMNPNIREQFWDVLLKYYHDCMTKSLIDILKCDRSDERLEPYSYENFIKHFAQCAFYGVMICIHFMPWMSSPEEDCEKMTKVFEERIESQEFHDGVLVLGGEPTDERIISILKFASKKGYMKIFE
uniref:Putative juvenile hormone-inducible protein n=1 Tax=Corethrella appendiculata TaxID=1370023 RepID=U5EDP7_9DIPT